MMCGSAKVRRLSTVSSVTKPADFILTTNWLWYWRTDQGQWIQYQHEANGGTCSITSKKLEVAFQDDIDGDILLSKGVSVMCSVLKECMRGLQLLYCLTGNLPDSKTRFSLQAEFCGLKAAPGFRQHVLSLGLWLWEGL
ncbi:hypothetical protein COCON_G00124350 [Conger conger]|uniref:WWE domain-containing protein n=1 Tax=Conger conger TaxID=82655 RepID=A0A9Q1HXB1_CONCO|nr:hypothetical protein COCON_G00124350 [Conger conger]